MKRITTILIAALVLTSCSKLMKVKLAESEGKDHETTEITTKLSAPPSEKDYKNDEVVSGNTITSVGAATGYAVQDASAARREEDKPAGTATVILSRMETKVPSKIIRNASISFQVDSTDRSHGHIVQLLTLYQAYFGSDSRVQYGDRIQQRMSIRVPAEHFDAIIEALMRESVYTDTKNITADDVTSEFVDVEARLKSKKEVEKRYIELLARAQKVTDVLEVENNLRVIREEIESTEGRLKLLRDQVGYSTIDLTIYQKVNPEIQPETGMGHRIREAAVNGWRGLEFCLLAMVNMWPLLVVISAVMLWLRVRRSRKA